jgi:hypothetical protein
MRIERMARRPARLLLATSCVGLLLLGLLNLATAPAGAASGHYTLMTQQLARGVPLRCADVDYAAAQALVEPVEVRWLSAAGVKCPNEQYEVMLALGSKGQLACPDVEWNSINGLVNWSQAAGLLWRVPGCVLTKYAFLVALSAQREISCVDVDWHVNVGLISPEQAGWLKAALASQGRPCPVVVPPPPPPGPPFSDGTHLVGNQIAPGRYIATGTAGCYWERLRGFSGSLSDIIANDFNAEGRVIVDIAGSDAAFSSSSCGTWSPWGPLPSPVASFGSGKFVVGQEIVAGRYQSNAVASNCYWERLRGFGGSFNEIITNHFGTSPAIVDISSSDVGFHTENCGAWIKVG